MGPCAKHRRGLPGYRKSVPMLRKTLVCVSRKAWSRLIAPFAHVFFAPHHVFVRYHAIPQERKLAAVVRRARRYGRAKVRRHG